MDIGDELADWDDDLSLADELELGPITEDLAGPEEIEEEVDEQELSEDIVLNGLTEEDLRLLREPNRDQTPTVDALVYLDRLLTHYPHSEYAQRAEILWRQLRTRLAQQITSIADYYAAIGQTLERNRIDFVVPDASDVFDEWGKARTDDDTAGDADVHGGDEMREAGGRCRPAGRVAPD